MVSYNDERGAPKRPSTSFSRCQRFAITTARKAYRVFSQRTYDGCDRLRGTEPNEWTNIRAMRKRPPPSVLRRNGRKVHRGFKTEVDDFVGDAETALIGNEQPLVCGHSLGGCDGDDLCGAVFLSHIKETRKRPGEATAVREWATETVISMLSNSSRERGMRARPTTTSSTRAAAGVDGVVIAEPRSYIDRTGASGTRE